MPTRPCLDCGTPTNTSRCPPCRRRHDRTRRPPPTARGYHDTQYLTNRATAIAEANGHCQRCCEPFTPDNPATAHHIDSNQARADRGLPPDHSRPNLTAVCRDCNSELGPT